MSHFNHLIILWSAFNTTYETLYAFQSIHMQQVRLQNSDPCTQQVCIATFKIWLYGIFEPWHLITPIVTIVSSLHTSDMHVVVFGDHHLTR